jgi:NADH:ubiquinone oxidoreductase subunit
MKGCTAMKMSLRLRKWNRVRGKKIFLRNPDVPGKPRRMIIWHDDLSKAKKPPAWMRELLFDNDAA